jgi:protocatechuate 3,4-dioxygenase beta subunit
MEVDVGIFSKLQALRNWIHHSPHSTRELASHRLRISRVEQLEDRRFLSAASPLNVGVVYYDTHSGTNTTGSLFYINWNGGAPGTQLTQLTINTDQTGTGQLKGNPFFSTAAGGPGVYGWLAPTIVQQSGISSATVSAPNGTMQMTINFTNFQANGELVLNVALDDMDNSGNVNSIVNGAEFAGSTFTAVFTANHYYSTTATGTFVDAYDSQLTGLGLNLPPDNYNSAQPVWTVGSGGALALAVNTTPQPVWTAGTGTTVQQVPLPITLSGTVYLDSNLDNKQEPGEPGIGGVVLTLYSQNQSGAYLPMGQTATTDSNGDYQFNGVLPGTYEIVKTEPAGYFNVGASAGNVGGTADGTVTSPDILSNITLQGGDNSVQNDFGEAKPASIAGTVFVDSKGDNAYDPGDPLVSNVTVDLLNASGTQVAQTTTNANGAYSFTDLAPGTYSVQDVQPAGYFAEGALVGSAGGKVNGLNSLTNAVLGSGVAATGYDFYEQLPASIAGIVFVDNNGSGAYQSGDPLVPNVTVDLLNAAGTQVAQTTTNANGAYSFTGLVPGTYSVQDVQPAGYIPEGSLVGTAGGQVNGLNSLTNAVLGSGAVATGYDFYEQLPASIAGTVFVDNNGSGEYQPGDPLVPNVTVDLLNAAGTQVAQTTTNANGAYSFTGLAPGTYSVQDVQPAGYIPEGSLVGTAGGQVNGLNSLTNAVLGSGAAATGYDFYEQLPASIAGTVFVDTNGSGAYQPGDPLLPGVMVDLLNASGTQVAQTTTNANGAYSFTGLVPGTYSVQDVQPAGYIAEGSLVGTAGGQVNGLNSLTNVALGSGAVATGYDFYEQLPASIAGKVFVDLNGTGKYQSNDTLLPGVTIELLDGSGNQLAQTTTNANGAYSFTGLAPGTYGVDEIQPAGYFAAGDYVGTAGGQVDSPNVLINAPLGSGVAATGYDFYENLPITISGYVFQDGPPIQVPVGSPVPDITTVRTGQLTASDKRLAGVTLTLADSTGVPIPGSDGNNITTVTDANGYYQFTGLDPSGGYSVLAQQPTGYLPGIATVGSKGGIVVNRYSSPSPSTLKTLAVSPQTDDAIVHIFATSGTTASSYNFSEVLVQQVPNPPPPGPFPAPPFVFPTLPTPSWGGSPAGAGFYSPTASGATFMLLGGGGPPVADDTWHLSVIDGGQPRSLQDGTNVAGDVPNQYFNASDWTGNALTDGEWIIADHDGRPARRIVFGLHGAIPVTGDWDGDGHSKVGVFLDGQWFLDLNGDGRWDPGDLWARLGRDGDLPVAGDWDGDGKTDIGIFGRAWPGDAKALAAERGEPQPENRPTGRTKNIPPDAQEAADAVRLLKKTAHGRLRADVIDHVFRFGNPGDRAVVGDWKGTGIYTIGVFRNGTWYLDLNGDGKWGPEDIAVQYGQAGDIPVVGDWTGDGITKIGVFREGTFYLDTNNNHVLDAGDKVIHLGQAGDLPVAGDFDGDGVDVVGVYHDTGGAAPAQASAPAAVPVMSTAGH